MHKRNKDKILGLQSVTHRNHFVILTLQKIEKTKNKKQKNKKGKKEKEKGKREREKEKEKRKKKKKKTEKKKKKKEMDGRADRRTDRRTARQSRLRRCDNVSKKWLFSESDFFLFCNLKPRR